MLYKAKENIRKAVETRSPRERQNWLAESLRQVNHFAGTPPYLSALQVIHQGRANP
jgi:hypothetical protein